jgi:lambda repressor-like predicted transcriptional regulator
MRKYRIKEVLDAQGRTLKWLADKIGCSYNTIRAYSSMKKSSKRTINKSIIFHMAYVMGVNPEEIDETWS